MRCLILSAICAHNCSAAHRRGGGGISLLLQVLFHTSLRFFAKGRLFQTPPLLYKVFVPFFLNWVTHNLRRKGKLSVPVRDS